MHFSGKADTLTQTEPLVKIVVVVVGVVAYNSIVHRICLIIFYISFCLFVRRVCNKNRGSGMLRTIGLKLIKVSRNVWLTMLL